jgi:hypothetical protein
MMHYSLLALSLVLASVPAAAVETDPGPLREAFFVRGGFNGWSLDNALRHKGKGIYEAEILVSPGNHGFKLGTRDWSREWVPSGAPSRDAGVAVKPDQAIPLATSAGPEATLFVRSTATSRSTPARRPPHACASRAWPSARADPRRISTPATRASPRWPLPPGTASRKVRAFR